MRLLIAVFVLVQLAGCVVVPVESWDEVPTTQKYQTDPADQIQRGDIVRVRTIKQNTHVFRVSKVEDNAFVGIARNSRTYRVPYNVLASLEVKRYEPEVIWMPVLIPSNFNPTGSPIGQANICC